MKVIEQMETSTETSSEIKFIAGLGFKIIIFVVEIVGSVKTQD